MRRFAFPHPQVPLSRGLSKDGAKVGLVVSSSVRHFSSIYLRDRLSSEDLLKDRATTCILQQEGTFRSVSNEKGLVLVVLFDNSFFPLLVFLRFLVLSLTSLSFGAERKTASKGVPTCRVPRRPWTTGLQRPGI